METDITQIRHRNNANCGVCHDGENGYTVDHVHSFCHTRLVHTRHMDGTGVREWRVVSHIVVSYPERKRVVVGTRVFVFFQKIKLLQRLQLLSDEAFLASLSVRRVSSIVSSSVVHHCALLITCCNTSSAFLDACLVRQSAIWYRASIHVKSASPSIAQWLDSGKLSGRSLVR